MKKVLVLPNVAEGTDIAIAEGNNAVMVDPDKSELVNPGTSNLNQYLLNHLNQMLNMLRKPDSLNHLNQKDTSAMETFENSDFVEAKAGTSQVDQAEGSAIIPSDSDTVINLHETEIEQKAQEEEIVDNVSPVQAEDAVTDMQADMEAELSSIYSTSKETESAEEHFIDNLPSVQPPDESAETVSKSVTRDPNSYS